ncbi:hypothetical protein [Bacillus thuringiensis]|uniref:hypothetical protein n=1 Tax=Bacillus thuringiensis TaxID=1428 RepID=UPI000BF6FC41|nr:hypothetical protein [Bacillus thuringiensis]PFS65522.1 hypothetical protein COK87_01930 [Bacillus thuringiensis]
MYKKAMVFFIDILGSRDRTDFQELYGINKAFHDLLDKNQGRDKPHTLYRRKVYTFSDCAYIVYDFKEHVDEETKDWNSLFNVALYNMEKVIMQFLENGFLCRGGVTYGEVYYEEDRSMFFGPAINKAYMLEAKIAKYPRIVVDEYIAKEVIQYNRNLVKSDPTGLIEKMNGDIVLKDKDDLYMLNYFNGMKLGNDFSKNQILIEELEILIDEQIKIQQKNMNDDNKKACENIIEKYNWLKEYLHNSLPKGDSHIFTLYS